MGGTLTVPEVLSQAAQRWPDAEALVDGEVRVTFAQLAERAGEVGRALVASGFEAGDRAAIWAPNIAEWAYVALGILGSGGVVVPINTRFKGTEARYVLERSGARFLFTVRGFLGNDYVAMIDEACAGDGELPALDSTVTMRGDGADFDRFLSSGRALEPDVSGTPIRGVGESDLSDIIFTSGTTGKPKGVMATHLQTVRVFSQWADVVGLAEEHRYLVVNPFFHTFGYKAGLVASLIKGATVYPMATFDVPAVLDVIQREKINVLPGPPTLFSSILDHPEREKYDLSSLELAVTGAAVVPIELIIRMRDELGFTTVLTAYGLTEATGTVTMCRRGDPPEIVAKTSGRAIPDTEVRVVLDNGGRARTGEPGEVVVRGYNVTSGYFEDPEQTAAVIDAEGWLHTGDIGVMDREGNLTITDRKKDMYIVGGFNAYPAEIENVLCSHPSVSQAAVIGVPDERLGEVGKAFVVCRPAARADGDELLGWAKEKMANYKVPRSVVFVDALPVNASGKVVKDELRALSASGGGTDSTPE